MDTHLHGFVEVLLEELLVVLVVLNTSHILLVLGLSEGHDLLLNNGVKLKQLAVFIILLVNADNVVLFSVLVSRHYHNLLVRLQHLEIPQILLQRQHAYPGIHVRRGLIFLLLLH